MLIVKGLLLQLHEYLLLLKRQTGGSEFEAVGVVQPALLYRWLLSTSFKSVDKLKELE